MPQLRKNVICLGVITAVAVVFFVLLPSVEVDSVAGATSQSKQRKEAPVSRIAFDPPGRQPSERRRLVSGVSHTYKLLVEQGELLELIVNQEGVDLQVEILDSRGKPLFTVDSPNGSKGPETVLLVALEPEGYRAQVSTRGPGGDGKYRIWIRAQRRATPAEVAEARAESLFHQAKETEGLGTFSSWGPHLQEAARLWEKTGNAGRQADAHRQLGKFYAQGQRHREAFQEWRRAKSLYYRARRLGDAGAVANDIGTLHSDLSELDAAYESYAEAWDLGKRARNARVATAALYNLGDVFRRQGRSAEALEMLEQVRLASKNLDSFLEGKALTVLGVVLSDVGQTDSAIESFQEALGIFEKLKDDEQRAIALTQMGNAYIRRREPERAEKFYQEALDIQERIGDKSNLPVTLNGLGLVHLNRKRPQKALGLFRKFLHFAKGRPALEAVAWTNLGWTYSELEQRADADLAYSQALRLAERTKDPWMKTAALLGFALLEEARRNPIEAQVRAEAAVRSVEELRQEANRDFKIPFMASQQDVYDTLIDILLWQHELRPSEGFADQALRVSEQARSRGLLDRILEESPARRADQIPRKLPILSLEEIQRFVLDSETLLLEYHLGRRASYLWVISETSFQIVKLPFSREDLISRVERVRRLLSTSNRFEKRREARKAAGDLSQDLLGPVSHFPGRKRLLISAPDILQALPFPALPDPASLEPETKSSWPRPLIVNYEVIKVSSASILAALQDRADARTPPEDLLAVLADPVFSFQDERFKGLGLAISKVQPETRLELGTWGRLPHTREEAESILREVGGRGSFSAFDFDATRDLFLSGKLSGFRNIHIATHGFSIINSEDRSSLVFSQVDSQGRLRDGRLRADEIYDLDLPADLITLSACETGLGERVPGEGLMGLPHAFFTAGATRVVVSLWKVNDRVTAKLMTQFYHEYLTQGHSPAAALREAQIAMWKSSNYNAPFYWGGFELQGDWRAVESSR